MINISTIILTVTKVKMTPCSDVKAIWTHQCLNLSDMHLSVETKNDRSGFRILSYGLKRKHTHTQPAVNACWQFSFLRHQIFPDSSISSALTSWIGRFERWTLFWGLAASGGLELEGTRRVSILFAFHRAPHSDTPLLNTHREHALTVAGEQTTSNIQLNCSLRPGDLSATGVRVDECIDQSKDHIQNVIPNVMAEQGWDFWHKLSFCFQYNWLKKVLVWLSVMPQNI